MKATFRLVAMFVVASCSGAVDPGDGSVVRDGDRVRGTGAVFFAEIEGGFFTIRGDDEKVYDPINLPDSFRVDGRRVRFEARLRPDLLSIHMMGELVELEKIERH